MYNLSLIRGDNLIKMKYSMVLTLIFFIYNTLKRIKNKCHLSKKQFVTRSELNIRILFYNIFQEERKFF